MSCRNKSRNVDSECDKPSGKVCQ